MSKFSRCMALAVVCSLTLTATAEAQNWPQWRGPEGTGHSSDTEAPTRWSADDVAWKTELPAEGQSSPVVWGERIFLTGATENGNRRMVFCLDRNGGKLLWKQTAWTGSNTEEVHKMNTYASATVATDGEHVVAFFGRGGLHCFDIDGKKLWSRDFGSFEGPWGTAASPIIHGDLVVQNCDADNAAFLVGLDIHSGKEVWRTQRPVVRGWSTPIIRTVGDHEELIMNGHTGTTGYDPATGSELWFCKGDNGRGTPTVAPNSQGALITVSGRPGAMFAVQPGGSGDVTESHQTWRLTRKGGRDLPSPLVIDDYLLVANMGGILTCYHALTGQELWTQRLGGNFSASPVAIDGHACFLSEEGTTHVIAPADRFQLVAKNQVGSTPEEIFRASPAVSQGQVFLRSNSMLYCVGKPSR
jgi:outer membrane protein assembly factor BamB